MIKLKVKKILRFYFSCERLNEYIDKLMLKIACSWYDGLCEVGADKICKLIEEKSELNKLWIYLDNVIKALPSTTVANLEKYAYLNVWLKRLPDCEYREMRRSVECLVRKLKRIDKFDNSVAIACGYSALLGVSDQGGSTSPSSP